jgi:Flp pilus assembly protein CpaB
MTVAIFAILVGLGGAFVVRQHLHQPGVPPLPELQPSNVVVPVALTDLEPGRELTLNDVAMRSFTPEQFAKTEFAKLAYMRQSTQIVGRTLKTSLKQGQAFMPEDLYPEGMGPDLAERLQAGYRAVTVPIENIGAVLGFARAGSFVDVLFRVDAVEERPEVTMTLLERVEVLAIDSYTNPGQQVQLEQDGSVTLAVTPHQAKMLKVVEGRGALTLTLRNPEDQFEFVPFDLGMADDSLSQAEPRHGATPVSYVADRTDFVADRGEAGDLSRAIGHASERVTLEDLLGFPPAPRKVQMEVYLGSNLQVHEFNEFDSGSDYLNQGGRIQTPIARQPAREPATVHSGGSSPFVSTGAAGQ